VCTFRDECKKRQGRGKKREKESIKAFTLPSKERRRKGEAGWAERAKGGDNEQEEPKRERETGSLSGHREMQGKREQEDERAGPV